MKKVLFVCLGNICRSPMAEAIMNQLIESKGLQSQIVADSAGTANYHVGDSPDMRTLKVLKKYGINTHHVGRQFTTRDFEVFDYIVAMDFDNLNHILQLDIKKNYKHKIHLMRAFDSVQTGSHVPDPYYGNMNDFEEVYQILQRSCQNLLQYILSEPKYSLCYG